MKYPSPVQIKVLGALRKRFEKEVRETAVKILKILKKRNVALDIFLVNGKEMRRLNRKFRSKDKKTDVLSFREPLNFPHPELHRRTARPPGGEFARRRSRAGTKRRLIRTLHLGEIYLNSDAIRKMRIHPNTAKNKNSQHSHSFAVWHRHLLIHGLLHLLGYGHVKKRDRMRMERQEYKLLQSLISEF